MFSSSQIQNNYKQPSNNNSLTAKRQRFHEQIRRKHIQQFIKNRRKVFMQQQQQKQVNKNSKKQQAEQFQQLSSKSHQQYTQFLKSFNYQLFSQTVNQSLQFLLQILFSPQCHHYKSYYKSILIIISQYISYKFNKAMNNFNIFKDMCKNKLEEELNQIVTKVVVYQQLFYWPYKKRNQINKNYQINQNKNGKINVCLFMDFLLGILYEISVISQEEEDKQNLYDNGYDKLVNINNNINNNNNTDNNNNDNNNNMNTQIYSIYDSFLTFCTDIITIGYSISYQRHPLLLIQKQYNQLIKSYQFSQYSSQFTFIYQQLFISPNTSGKLISHSLDIMRNISSLCLSNDNNLIQLFINQQILLQLEYYLTQYPTTETHRQKVAEIYSNLVEEEIEWYKNNKNKNINNNNNNNNNININNNNSNNKKAQKIQQELQYDYCDNNICNKRPGIYLDLLKLLSQTQDNTITIQQICHILYQILLNYTTHQHIKNSKQSNQFQIQLSHQLSHQQSNQFIFNQYQCKTISQIITFLFNQIDTKQLQLQYLSNLFILVCSKLLSYILYMNKMIDILKLIIINQNKLILQYENKAKKFILKQSQQSSDNHNNYSIDHNYNNNIVKSYQKQKRISQQNIKSIISQCTILIYKYHFQLQSQSNSIQHIQTIKQYGYNYLSISQDIIQCIFTLYQQNQLNQSCNLQLMKFMLMSVKKFPQYLIKLNYYNNKKNYYRTQSYLLYLEEIQQKTIEHGEIYVEMVQYMLQYLFNKYSNTNKQNKNMVVNHFTHFQANYRNILQKLEGLLYKENINSNNNQETNLNQKIQTLYQFLTEMLNKITGNIQMQA